MRPDPPFHVRAAFVAGGLMLSALATGCTQPGQSQPPAAAAAVPPPAPTSVRTWEVVAQPLEAFEDFTGEILADIVVDVAPVEAGRLVELAVDEGAEVIAGQIIGRVDDELQALRRGELTAQRTSAERRSEQAEAEIQELERDIERRRPLVERGAFSSAELERLEDRLAVLRTAVETVRAQEREVDALSRTAAQQLARRAIVAPISGTVVARMLDPGAMVSAQTPIVTMVDTSSLELIARIPERRLAQVQLGSRAYITLDAAPGETLNAEITRIGQVVDRTSRTVEIRLRVAPGAVALRHGMFAHGRLVVGGIEASPIVPVETLSPLATGPAEGSADGSGASSAPRGTHQVWVVQGDSTVVRREVTVILESDRMAAVSGLNVGEQVVMSPPRSLTDGATVVVASPAGARP